MKRISIFTKEHIYFISPSEVLYCKSNNSSTTIHLENNEVVVVSKGLKAVERLFKSAQFIRPHQSYLVNQNHIVLIDKANDFNLILSNQVSIPVSVRRRKAMLDIVKIGI